MARNEHKKYEVKCDNCIGSFHVESDFEVLFLPVSALISNEVPFFCLLYPFRILVPVSHLAIFTLQIFFEDEFV